MEYILYENVESGVIHTCGKEASAFTHCGLPIAETKSLEKLEHKGALNDVTCYNCLRAVTPRVKKKNDEIVKRPTRAERPTFVTIDQDMAEVLEGSYSEEKLMENIEEMMIAEWETRVVYVAKIYKKITIPRTKIENL